MALLSLDPAVPYRELRDPALDPALRAAALACFAAQRAAAPAPPAANDAQIDAAVSPAKLDELLHTGRVVGGISGERDIATAFPFNMRHVSDTLRDAEVAARRRRLDRALEAWIARLFAPGEEPVVFQAGHWWYPPGTYLRWHTNERFPGWRLYLSHAEEPGASFFRYRDPRRGEIVTTAPGICACSRCRPSAGCGTRSLRARTASASAGS